MTQFSLKPMLTAQPPTTQRYGYLSMAEVLYTLLHFPRHSVSMYDVVWQGDLLNYRTFDMGFAVSHERRSVSRQIKDAFLDRRGTAQTEWKIRKARYEAPALAVIDVTSSIRMIDALAASLHPCSYLAPLYLNSQDFRVLPALLYCSRLAVSVDSPLRSEPLHVISSLTFGLAAHPLASASTS
ncbi:hypothetical protein B0H19DRAFT_1071481 [Mycena capillaripes]|nr:hypothetical protein B0H19DRAFT_1071481 [Mycena capillaripes]